MTRTFSKIGSCLVPADPDTLAAVSAMRPGAIVTADFKLKNNYEFHKKLMSLLNMAFEYWQPGEVSSKHGTPCKNFDRFRKDLTILAGFYEVVIRLDGSTVIEPKSLRFDKMDHAERQQVYQAILTVIWERVFPELNKGQIEDMAAEHWQRLLSYT